LFGERRPAFVFRYHPDPLNSERVTKVVQPPLRKENGAEGVAFVRVELLEKVIGVSALVGVLGGYTA
jgi:hypothetical protein